MSCVGKRDETEIGSCVGETGRYGDRDIQRETKGSRREVVGGRMID